jgi:hypothetical protein
VGRKPRAGSIPAASTKLVDSSGGPLRQIFVALLFVDDRISFAASEQLTALQKTSGGSWLLTASAFRQRVKADSTLAPIGREIDFGKLGNTREALFTTWSLGGGGAYTWVFASHWTAFFTLTLGLGPQWQDLETQSFGTLSAVRLAGRSNGRFTIGYCGEEFFIGVSAITDTTFLQVDDQLLDFSALYAFGFLGIRFDLL